MREEGSTEFGNLAICAPCATGELISFIPINRRLFDSESSSFATSTILRARKARRHVVLNVQGLLSTFKHYCTWQPCEKWCKSYLEKGPNTQTRPSETEQTNSCHTNLLSAHCSGSTSSLYLFPAHLEIQESGINPTLQLSPNSPL